MARLKAPEHLAANIRARRLRVPKESVQSLANAVGADYRTIYDIEKKGSNPSVALVAKIAQHYGVTIDDLVTGDLTTRTTASIEGTSSHDAGRSELDTEEP